MPEKKKITYILGAGASQAEVSMKNPAIRILMGNIKDAIHLRIQKEDTAALREVANELAGEKVDVEHLISLYESSGSHIHLGVARKLRQFFREEIQNKIKLLGDDFSPTLLTSLLDMHSLGDLPETLLGILTLNYDGFIETAMHDIFGGVDLGFEINSKHSKLQIVTSTYPLLKLHGSFNWKNEFPVSLVDETTLTNEEEYLWIPPGVEKKREKYPFSLLWGKAREMLLCDTLRIIGCSLSRNDWELISMMYTTQSLSARDVQYDIEIIDFDNRGEEIKNAYSYLKIKILLEIPEVRDYLTDEVFQTREQETVPNTVKEYVSEANQKLNIFELWLKAKGAALKKSGASCTTTKNHFSAFLDEA